MGSKFSVNSAIKKQNKTKKRIKNGPGSLFKSEYMSLYLFSINLFFYIVICKTSGT